MSRLDASVCVSSSTVCWSRLAARQALEVVAHAHLHAQARDELGRPERLAHVVVGAAREHTPNLLVRVERREHDDRHLGERRRGCARAGAPRGRRAAASPGRAGWRSAADGSRDARWPPRRRRRARRRAPRRRAPPRASACSPHRHRRPGPGTRTPLSHERTTSRTRARSRGYAREPVRSVAG